MSEMPNPETEPQQPGEGGESGGDDSGGGDTGGGDTGGGEGGSQA
ncbi:MAG: hypothetical protein QOE92_803 [Chloroflexota bacterium]|jgi:hypothetical protein|nr:hypothetical protein [Chloroflexota bacterium]